MGIDCTLRSMLARIPYTVWGAILRGILLFSIFCVQGIFFALPFIMISYMWIFDRKINYDFFFPIFQTNIFEIQEFLFGFLPHSLWIVVLLLCVFLLYVQRDTLVDIGKKQTYILGAFSCLLFLCLLVCNLQRNLPLYRMYLGAKEVYYTAPLMYTLYREENKKKLHIDIPEKKGLYVVILGESVTSVGWGAYGYHRNTTPFISSNINNPQYTLIHRAYAPEITTEPAVFYMLTNTNQYSTVDDKEILSLIDVLKTAGFKTIWVSNQGSYNTNSAKVRSISDEADSIISDIGGMVQVEQYDEHMLPHIEKIINEEYHEGGIVIFIHLYGSHIRYHHRYDRNKYSIFHDTPTYPYGEKASIVHINHYDNSIYATDDFLRRITNMVNKRDDFQFLVYISDHGEGVYRGVPRGNPEAMVDVVQVPLYFYMSHVYREENNERVATLRANAKRGYSTDMLFDTLLGLFNIKASCYSAHYDISSQEYKYSYETLKTQSGSVYIHDLFKEHRNIQNRE